MNQLIRPETVNFNELVKNSNTTLSLDLQTTMIKLLNEEFCEEEQKWYVANLFMFTNYHPTADFPINLETVVKIVGFAHKKNAKRALENNFTEGEDYKIRVLPKEQSSWGGSGGEEIMLNMDTFKNLCMLVKTPEGKAIRKYYVKLENITNKIIQMEIEEQKLQLEKQKQLSIEQKEQTELEKEILLETTLLQQFPVNTQCIYVGKIDNKDSKNGNLVSFGMSNNLQERIKVHKKTYTNFRLTNVFKVNNHIEIENCIKKHKILKQRIRYLVINDINYREHLCIDSDKKDPEFTLHKLYNYIKEIIDENQYNIENYKKLIDKNSSLENELRVLRDENKTLTEKNNKLQLDIDKFNPNIEEKYIKSHSKQETVNGYSLFAYEINNLRYKIGLSKNASLESKEKMYKASYPNGSMKLKILLKHSFMEKIMQYLLKKHLTFLNNDTFDGSLDDIKLILYLVSKIEDMLINNDTENIIKIINNDNKIEIEYNDPEIPYIRKAKRPVDQIDKDTGKILNTYPSIEAAGRALGLTSGTAIGISLRNKSLSQGYMWRYSGISKEDQMQDQKVIRINCKNGDKTFYPNIASAAKNAKISAPGLRSRILTDVHTKGYHWVFDKDSSHYST
jgi:phage anti-repressor protein